MFKVKVEGENVRVTRSVVLPKVGKLPEVPLQSGWTIKMNLKDIDRKSKAGQEIIKSFENSYLYELKMRGTKQDNDFVKRWNDAAKAINSGGDAKKIEAFATKFQNDVIASWNAFNAKDGKRYATAIMETVVKQVAKDQKTKLEAPKLSYAAEELKSNRVNILTAILGALTAGVATSGLGWVAVGLGAVATLASGYFNAWQIAQKRAGDVQTNLAVVHRTLTSCESSLSKLNSEIDFLKQSGSAISSQLSKVTVEMNKAKGQLEKLEKRAKTEKQVKEGNYINSVRSRIENAQSSIESLRKDSADTTALIRSLEAARDAVKKAKDLSEIERKGWDGIMDRYVALETDSKTTISALQKLLKAYA